jgi:hypothetical protein
MSCDEELNALRQAEQELARFRERHPGIPTSTDLSPAGDVTTPTAVQGEDVQRLAELAAAVRDRENAYNRCRDRVGSGTDVESLMRDETGAPRGGSAGPPM